MYILDILYQYSSIMCNPHRTRKSSLYLYNYWHWLLALVIGTRQGLCTLGTRTWIPLQQWHHPDHNNHQPEAPSLELPGFSHFQETLSRGNQ